MSGNKPFPEFRHLPAPLHELSAQPPTLPLAVRWTIASSSGMGSRVSRLPLGGADQTSFAKVVFTALGLSPDRKDNLTNADILQCVQALDARKSREEVKPTRMGPPG